jgi:hypothetical protein
MQTKLIMKIKSLQSLLNCSLRAGLGCCLIGAASLKADTLVTFSVDMGASVTAGTFTPGTDTVSANGSFNGWGALNLVQEGSSTVYTNTADDQLDANGGVVFYKFVNSHSGIGYENLCDGGGNRGAALPSVSGSSLILPTPFFGDAGAAITYTSTITFQVDMSQQINLGNFIPGTSTIQVSGNFNGWTPGSGNLALDSSILITNQPSGLVTSNVYTGTFTSVAVSTNAHMAYKFVMNGNYGDNPSGLNNDGGNNRFFTMLPTDQTLPVVSYADAPYAPIVGNITFSVDMSIVALTDTNFIYGVSLVTVNGDLPGWGGVTMTNNPTAANTNIYTVIGSWSDGVGASFQYQYRYTEASSGSIVYDHLNGANGGGGNRSYIVQNVPSTNLFSVFNDASLDDYLLQPTPVFFSVDMNGAVGTDAHTFDPSQDNVYINGTFANWYAWESGSAPAPAPPGYQMVEQGLTTIYTNTIIIPAGNSPDVAYKFGMDPGAAYGGPLDDEAGFGLNHIRAVRATAFNPYVMPADKFGNQYAEPYFSLSSTGGGNLTIGAPSGGSVPVTWLGRPGAHLQVTSDLVSGSWQDLIATDGTNWTTGYSSTNGFVSQTNWPASGQAFFRLVKP